MTEVIPVPKSFANNFWGKDDAGYTILTAKMANSKKTFDDLKAFYTARSSLHEEFGKKLMKHLKNDLGRDETGTLGVLLTSAYRELEMTAQANIELAQKIKVNLELRLDNFILDQKDTRKLVQTSVDKAHRNKQLHTAHVAKAKEKYESECVKQISYEGQLTTAGFREADRLRQKLDKCTHDIGVFEQEYKSACAKLADATTIWNNEWKYACDKYQEMEEKRVEFMHHSFSVYVNILSTATSHDQESYERFWNSLDQCDPKKDIAIFIDEKGTGALIPDPPVYVHYMDDPAKTLPTYHIAQFPTIGKTATTIEPTKTSPSDESQENGGSVNDKPSSRHSYKHPHSTDISSNITGGHRSTSVRQAPQQRIAKQLPAITKKEINRKQPGYDITPSSTIKHTDKRMTPSVSRLIDSSSSSKEDDDIDQEDDVEIDPRAKVVFAIGNNVFEVDNKQKSNRFGQYDHTKDTPLLNKSRHTSLKKNKKVDEAFDLSIKELLEELGVYEATPGNNKKNDNSQESALDINQQSHSTGGLATTSTTTASRSSQQAPNVLDNRYTEQQPSMYMQLQQHYSSTKDTTQQEFSKQVDQGVPPPMQEGIQWARALYDRQAPDGYLNFFQGNWLAVVRVENDSWCLAYLWDDASETLSTQPGYVATNFIQFVQ
ncbi:hypothetical protein BC941DRAFT_411139 [Chlamydoabsidia padenii]|nr:hypothetical protein BC941DRAFT_411139 [Chlamydoabsidia padenii]